MKVRMIQNKDNSVYYVANVKKFCQEKGLTRRLLDRTPHERSNHKGYFFVNKNLEFIPSEEGDKTLYGTDITGYVISTIDKDDRKEILVNKEVYEKNLLIQLSRKVESQKQRCAMLKKQADYTNNLAVFLQEIKEEIHNKLNIDCSNPIEFKSVEGNNDYLIVQLTDLHIGKFVDLPHNKFNYKVARQRLMNYKKEIIKYIQTNKISKVMVVFTGDLFNLDYRIEQLLTNEFNRAESFVKCLEVISEFLIDLSKLPIDLKVRSVVGNESRINTNENLSFVDSVANNNFDTLLFKVLKFTLGKIIEFEGEGDKLIDCISLNGYNVCILHGNNIKHNENEFYKLKLRLSESFNKNISYIILGHVHSTYITSFVGRSGSLVGGDEYATNGLNIPSSIASQNIYVVKENMGVIGIEIKLN